VSQQQRFDPESFEGQLLTSGRVELPTALARHRAAQRLGLSAAALGVASASVSSVATAATSVTAGSALSLSFVKALVIGVAVGASGIGAIEVARHANAPRTTSSAQRTSPRPRSEQRVGATLASRSGPLAVDLSPPATANVDAPLSRAGEPAMRAAMASDTVAVEPVNVPVSHHSVAERASASPTSVRPTGLVPRTTALQAGTSLPLATQAAPVSPRSGRTSEAAASSATVPGVQGANAANQLGDEISSLDRARSALSRGAPDAALHELDAFGRSYRVLGREVMLVRIDALLALQRKSEAAALARQLLAKGAPAPQRARLEQIANAAP
jgi:hypothetical protein